ncbi:MAG: GNAT family N-acetyltransferase [Nocardioidaceae bacterium]
MTLRLVALTAESLAALYEGRADWAREQPELADVSWPEDDRRVLRYRHEALAADPASAPYLLHAALIDGAFVGRIGCHAAPDETGTVEIGYAVATPLRRQGIGGQVVDAFLRWLEDQGVARVVASVAPDNEPSMRLLAKRGFVRVGEHWDDEDGLELVLGRDLTVR